MILNESDTRRDDNGIMYKFLKGDKIMICEEDCLSVINAFNSSSNKTWVQLLKIPSLLLFLFLLASSLGFRQSWTIWLIISRNGLQPVTWMSKSNFLEKKKKNIS